MVTDDAALSVGDEAAGCTFDAVGQHAFAELVIEGGLAAVERGGVVNFVDRSVEL